MSGRGGGARGGGRGQRQGRGQGQGQQQFSGRGGGGSGGGRGRGGGSGHGRGSSGYSAPTPSPVASSSSLSSDVEKKLTLQPSAPAWVRPSSSTQPQIAPASQAVQPQPAPLVQASPPVQAVQQPQQQQQLDQPPVSSKAIGPPQRPGYGTIGRKCIVRANHFLVQVKDGDLHHYDVTISPEVLNKKKCREIVAELVKNYRESHLGKRWIAYDGRKSAYTGGPLPFVSKEFVINLSDDDGARERQFKVSIKFAAKADLDHLRQFLLGRQLDSPQETIQALDVALRAMPSSLYEVVGRSFFSPDLGNYDELGNGVEYWRGFYQSLRPTQMGLSLNIDLSARGFYEPILVTEFVAKYFNRDVSRPLSDQECIKLRKVLKGLRVELNHQGYKRRCKISGLSVEPLHKLTFDDETGAKKSVVQYFRDKYRIALKYTSLPALQFGSDAKATYMPMEISRIAEGQRYTRKLNERQVTELLRATCQRPEARERSIKEMVRYNNYNSHPLVNKEFGIHVTPELTSVEARVLPPPMLKYHETGQESRVDPRVGQWNMINKKMINGAKVAFWTGVSFSGSNLDVVKFCKDLISMCCSKGMEFNPTPLLPVNYAHPAQIEKVLHDIGTQSAAKLGSGKQLQLLIVVLPDVTGSYGKIKKACETNVGIVTQCCRAKQAIKGGKQYLENLALKINVKTGGRNSVLEQAIMRRIPFLTDRPTIVFGADVTHPQPGEDSSPSIAAVVASMDWPEVTKYRALVSAQTHRQEMIADLCKTYQDPTRGTVKGGLVRELLIEFRRSTGYKPHRIIFYRDGVSEGQFNQVLLHEMDAIRQACESLEEGYQPPVTFIVVQKRHHTRLFPERHGDRNSTDKSGNILPGTVVDTQICHPSQFDFYLCSHAGIQGTSRPTHYHVLYDENEFTADGLQMLTNSLCYTYARCTRSVSIVPPAYYAHLAAFRARDYMEGEFSDSGSSSGGGSKATRESKAFKPLPVIKDNVKGVMFYC